MYQTVVQIYKTIRKKQTSMTLALLFERLLFTVISYRRQSQYFDCLSVDKGVNTVYLVTAPMTYLLITSYLTKADIRTFLLTYQ